MVCESVIITPCMELSPVQILEMESDYRMIRKNFPFIVHHDSTPFSLPPANYP